MIRAFSVFAGSVVVGSIVLTGCGPDPVSRDGASASTGAGEGDSCTTMGCRAETLPTTPLAAPSPTAEPATQPTAAPIACTTGPCAAGTFESAQCTATSDRVCSACAECTDDTFEISACTPTANRVCSPCKRCVGDTFEERACTSTTNRVCVECSTCPNGIASACGRKTDTLCKGCSGSCAAGTFESRACTANGDRVCAACTACPLDTFETAACTSRSNRACAPCTPCTTGMVEVAACTETSDRVCAACASCAAGTYASKACTATENTTCVACTECAPGESEATACTPTTDRLCVARPAALLVASYTNGPLGAQRFSLSSAGNAAPLSNITGANTTFAGPSGIAHDRTRGLLYVADFDSNSIKVFHDTAAGNVAPLRVLSITSPVQIVLDEPNDRLFIPSATDNKVVIVDRASSATGAVMGRAITGLTMPYGLAYDAGHDRLFFTEAGSRVSVVEHASTVDGPRAATVQRTVTGAATGLTSAYSLTFDPATQRVFATTSGSKVVSFDGTSADGDIAPLQTITISPALAQTWGIAFDGVTNELFVGDLSGNHYVVVGNALSANGPTTALREVIGPQTAVNGASAFVVDR